jgi:hypothetical protein
MRHAIQILADNGRPTDIDPAPLLIVHDLASMAIPKNVPLKWHHTQIQLGTAEKIRISDGRLEVKGK